MISLSASGGSAPPDRGVRVALMIESDGPGGAENVILHLGRELQNRGHEVTAVLPAAGCGWLGERCREEGLQAEHFRLRGPVDPLCVLGLARRLRGREIDVVHSHEFTMAVYGAAACGVLRVPHVITLHGGRYVQEKRRRVRALRWACRRSRHVVTVSETTRGFYADALGIAEHALEVIPNGVPAPVGDRGRGRRELCLREDELLILAVGNLYQVKGHAVLVDALSRLLARRPDVEWSAVVAGRGEEEAALRALATDRGIGERFRLLGYRSDVADLLAAADIYVMPSLSEGLPLALLEAMLAGLPVVASAVGGIPRVARAEREAILTPSGDPEGLARALERLVGNPGLRAELGASARARAEGRYTVTAMTEAYERLYASALGRPGR